MGCRYGTCSCSCKNCKKNDHCWSHGSGCHKNCSIL